MSDPFGCYAVSHFGDPFLCYGYALVTPNYRFWYHLLRFLGLLKIWDMRYMWYVIQRNMLLYFI